MAVQLEIRDGPTYWWASPDIWVVPGSDPTGAPGMPVVGQPAFVWDALYAGLSRLIHLDSQDRRTSQGSEIAAGSAPDGLADAPAEPGAAPIVVERLYVNHVSS